MNPKSKVSRVELWRLVRLLDGWENWRVYCTAETAKYPRATYARREWEARDSTLRNCISDLRAVSHLPNVIDEPRRSAARQVRKQLP